MNADEKTYPDFSILYDMLNAPILWGLLKAALELELFFLLDRPRSTGEVAGELGSHPGNTGVLLDGLTAAGLLEKDQGQYRNTPVAQRYLVGGGPCDLGPMLFNLARMRHAGLDSLAELVRQGPAAAREGTDLKQQDTWSKATAFLANYHRAGIGEDARRIVSALPEYPGMKKMLDLGGGPGLIGMTIVKSHPSLRGVLFDLPPVVAAAGPHIAQMGLQDRMEVLAGDYNEDPIGQGYDLVWASLNLYYARENLEGLMEKIRQALNPGGVMVSYHEGLTHQRTAPACHVIGRIAPAFRGQDLSFDQGQIAEAMLAAGFRSVRSRTLETSNGPIDLDIARC
jgi:SAM-dependent methyltransferase